MNDRKEYMKSTYAKYWSRARKDIYGFMEYDRALIDLICGQLPINSKKQLLEVASGTGEPFAKDFLAMGHDLSGVDISDLLVAQCKQNIPEINCEVGDAEDLPYPDSIFDLTYCVHSTWYFPNLCEAVSEMIRVTKYGGGVIFDIQNIYNDEINRIYKSHVFENTTLVGNIYKVIKNTAKFILQRGTRDWPFVVSEIPSDPTTIFALLSKLSVSQLELFAWHGNQMVNLGSNVARHEQYSRLIFIVIK